MLQLEERQLHIVMFLMMGVSIVLFCFFGIQRIPEIDEFGKTEGMKNFSDGWICSYETDNVQKLEEYRSTEENATDPDSKIIREVVTFPSVFSVAEEKTLILLHRVPELNVDTVYMVMETDSQAIRVSVEQTVIYESDEKEAGIPAVHVIPISAQYKDNILTVELTDVLNKDIEVKSIYTGTRNQLLVELIKENIAAVATGILLVCISLCMLLVWFIVQNTWRQKGLLLYCSLEGIVLGLLFTINGKFFPVLTGWNYGVNMLKSFAVILAGVLHLMIIRSLIYKKKVLKLVDTGIFLYGIFFISIIVLQAFSLLQFNTVYSIGKWLFAISVLVYTIVLAVAVYEYNRTEGKPVLYANAFLILCLVIQLIMQFSGREVRFNDIFIPVGLVVYMVFVWIIGLKMALYMVPEKEELPYNEEQIRTQIVAQLNPNLLFASFHTLQNLIKRGSSKSIKMLYYISVYFRNNLKALENSGEVITFEEELGHIIAYLQLQKTRNADLSITIESKVKDFKVPRHSLEPMVENAVKHGIAGKGNKGNIVIRTYLRSEGYAVQIIDDGIGFDKKILRRQSPTALLNLFSTLERVYQAQTEIISKEGKGTVITIVFPMLENELIDNPDEETER